MSSSVGRQFRPLPANVEATHLTELVSEICEQSSFVVNNVTEYLPYKFGGTFKNSEFIFRTNTSILGNCFPSVTFNIIIFLLGYTVRQLRWKEIY